MRSKIVLLILVALVAVGCSASDSADTDASSGASTAAPPQTTVAASTAPQTTAPETTDAATTTSPPASTAPSAGATVADLVSADRVVNLAHAGGDQSAPHSTMFAFDQAVQAGATALELDVQRTADGEIVVQHDLTVDKTTETVGPVNELTLAEIQALDNAYWFSPECWPCQDRPTEEYIYRGVRTGEVEPPAGYTPDDFRVITLRELSERFPNIVLDIEIKGPEVGGVATEEALATARAVADELIALGREDSAIVVAFSDDIVDAFHEAAPNISVSPGLGRLTEWFLNGAALEPYFEVIQVPPFQSGVQVVTAESVARAHSEGLAVWVWPNDASEQENTDFYIELIGYGVDGVIAGRPADMTAAIDLAPAFVPPVASVGCGASAPVAGPQVLTVASGGLDRSYHLFVPTAYDGEQPTPVVLNFHGYTSTADIHIALSEMEPLAEVEGFITVAPAGTGTVPFWNIGTDNDLVDDVAFVADLLDELESDLCVDTNRIFATGLSNGGWMTSRLACVMADRIAAVAPVAATMFFDDCTPSRPIPLLSVHGTDDQIVPFTGVRANDDQLEGSGLTSIEPDPGVTEMFSDTVGLGADNAGPDITTEVEEWSNHNACRPGGETLAFTDDIDLTSWVGCSAPVELYVVQGGGHSWPGSDLMAGVDSVGFTTMTVQAQELVWQFFQANPLR